MSLRKNKYDQVIDVIIHENSSLKVNHSPPVNGGTLTIPLFPYGKFYNFGTPYTEDVNGKIKKISSNNIYISHKNKEYRLYDFVIHYCLIAKRDFVYFYLQHYSRLFTYNSTSDEYIIT